MKKLELTKIGLFNPGRLTDEEIELSFVTRIAFFQYIFKKIIAEKPNSIPQHHLVIGQRGMGKTSLLVRIAVELRKQPYCDNFIALTFPEEQYNIDRLSKFWLNCLDALADALDRENQTEFTKILDAEIDGIAKSHHQENNAIYAIFEQWTKKINRRPVLLVDNLNLIFDKISKDEQHQLRAILMSNNAPIMLGASATTIDDTVDYGAAFYDAFSIQYLKKLTLDESIEVLQNLAKLLARKILNKLFIKIKLV
jgi:Cdc6-like AAA superfamily ATPase